MCIRDSRRRCQPHGCLCPIGGARALPCVDVGARAVGSGWGHRQLRRRWGQLELPMGEFPA
eukprot:9512949-Alexandrium_andersonii.AAC.1